MHLNCGIVALDPGPLAETRIVEEMVDSIGHRGLAALGHCRLSILDLSRGYKPIANEDGAVRISFDRKINHCSDLLGHARPVPTNPRRRGRGYFEARVVADMLQRTQAAEDLSAEISSLLALERWHREFVDTDHRATLDRAERPKREVA
jgi:hypothetical protein